MLEKKGEGLILNGNRCGAEILRTMNDDDRPPLIFKSSTFRRFAVSSFRSIDNGVFGNVEPDKRKNSINEKGVVRVTIYVALLSCFLFPANVV